MKFQHCALDTELCTCDQSLEQSGSGFRGLDMSWMLWAGCCGLGVRGLEFLARGFRLRVAGWKMLAGSNQPDVAGWELRAGNCNHGMMS